MAKPVIRKVPIAMAKETIKIRPQLMCILHQLVY